MAGYYSTTKPTTLACAVDHFCSFCIVVHVQPASHLSLCMMQATTVVPPTVRSMVHVKVSLQGGSQPNLCTRKVAALLALTRRSSVCDQVSCLNHSARLHRRHVPVSSQRAQFCAASHRIKLSFTPTSVLKGSVCRCHCDHLTPGQRP